MTLSIEKTVNQKLAQIFADLELDPAMAVVKPSDRPDLSDLQCNGALALAKKLHKNPREIAQEIVARLAEDSDIAAATVDGPGFINISLSNEFIARSIDSMAADPRFGCAKTETPLKVVMDYGGPNVAKALHVGHLRSAVIGDSIRRIEEFVGNEVISDVHFGDWGTPMGMIIAEIIRQDGNLDKVKSYDIDAISAIYKQANIRCKEDEDAKETARQITAELQNKRPEYYQAWQQLRRVSVDAVKKIYDELGVRFDLWLGESDAHRASGEIVALAEEKGISEIDDGATIIRLPQTNKPMPPVILVKSGGGFGYQVTDIATIKMRVDDLKAEEIIYVVDKRQALHFEQVFATASILGIAPEVKFCHIEFGTVNGADGKPFKTRDGGVMNLEDLINLSREKVLQSMPQPDEVPGFGAAEIEKLVNQITIGAIKFQDLKNSIASGYVFELDDFAKFDGKTGPYIQYAVARINSILRKMPGAENHNARIVLEHLDERTLALKLSLFENMIMRAYKEKEPSVLTEYAYTLAQTFSTFYNSCPIISAAPNIAASRLKLACLVRDVLKQLLYLLGIEAPEVMLKANRD